MQASYGMKKRFGNVTDFNPYFGTDYGICSLIKPQLTFNPELGKSEQARAFYKWADKRSNKLQSSYQILSIGIWK